MKWGGSSLHSSQLLVLHTAQESSCLCFQLPWICWHGAQQHADILAAQAKLLLQIVKSSQHMLN